MWGKFYKKIKAAPELQLIEDWIIYQGEENAKNMITQSALKSALYIKEYIKTQRYKDFISKLNTEFSYNIFQQNIILKHNMSQIISKVNVKENSEIEHDSIKIISNNTIYIYLFTKVMCHLIEYIIEISVMKVIKFVNNDYNISCQF